MKINFENKTVTKTVDNIFFNTILVPISCISIFIFYSFCIINFGAYFFLSGTSDVLSYSFGFKENFKWQI